MVDLELVMWRAGLISVGALAGKVVGVIGAREGSTHFVPRYLAVVQVLSARQRSC